MTNRLTGSANPLRRIVVGVSGHRFLAETDRLIAGIDGAISRMETVLGRPLTVLSSLA
jgi:hypothetical protein